MKIKNNSLCGASHKELFLYSVCVGSLAMLIKKSQSKWEILLTISKDMNII